MLQGLFLTFLSQKQPENNPDLISSSHSKHRVRFQRIFVFWVAISLYLPLKSDRSSDSFDRIRANIKPPSQGDKDELTKLKTIKN